METFTSVADVRKQAQIGSRYKEGAVYDLTEFARQHPGGQQALLRYKGQDVSEILFDPMIHRHSFSAVRTMEPYKIGNITPSKSQPKVNPQTNTQQTSQQSTATNNGSQSEILKQPVPQSSTSSIVKAPLKDSQNARAEFQKSQSQVSSKIMVKQNTAKFLEIPNPREVLHQQKAKMHRMLEEERQKMIKQQEEELAQMSLAQQSQKAQTPITQSVAPSTQSEILNQVSRPLNPIYEQWKQNNEVLKRQQQSQLQLQTKSTTSYSQSLEDIQLKPRIVNPYYEQWKQQQLLQSSGQTIKEQDEEATRKRQMTNTSSPSLRAEETPKLIIPSFQSKFLDYLKK